MASPYEKLIRDIKRIMHGIDEEIHDFDSPNKTWVSEGKYFAASRAITQLSAMCRDLEEIENWRRHSVSHSGTKNT